MGPKTALCGALGLATALAATTMFNDDWGSPMNEANAKQFISHSSHRRSSAPFQFLDTPVRARHGKAAAALEGTTLASLSGGPIAALPDGNFAVIDGDSGLFLLTDADGTLIDSLNIGPDASELAVDGHNKIAYVADRSGDRIWKLSVGNGAIVHQHRAATPAEPYGVALTPSGKTLLVTTVADRKLVAYNTATMKKRWALSIPPEARGVAVSPDGREALITHLSTGTVTYVDLKTRRTSHTALNETAGKTPTTGFDRIPKPVAINTAKQSVRQAKSRHRNRHRNNHRRHARILQAQGVGLGVGSSPGDSVLARVDNSAGKSFARNAFAATYLRGGLSVVAYQVSTPQQDTGGREQVGTYGGGFSPPIQHQVAFIAPRGSSSVRRAARASVSLHQPRALAYDAKSDTLYMASIGNDLVSAIGNASTPNAALKWSGTIQKSKSTRCGATGLAIGSDGRLRAFCSFTRRVAVFTTHKDQPLRRKIVLGKELAPSRLSSEALLGKQIFHTGGDFRLSTRGAMACASCHPEGRADALSWRIEGHTLQTPLLTGGRLSGTHPFKWDGKDPDLTASLTNTVRRLGGRGIDKREVRGLKAFFATLPTPRTPSADASAVARGEKLFRSRALGCESCHSGKRYTNGESYALSDILGEVDTPSLLGLASSAPYYHDGSASDLRALLNGKGEIHGMSGIDRVKPAQFDDLIAFLESL